MSEIYNSDAILKELDSQLSDFSDGEPRRPKNDFSWQSLRGERDVEANNRVIRCELAKVPLLAEFICSDLVSLIEGLTTD